MHGLGRCYVEDRTVSRCAKDRRAGSDTLVVIYKTKLHPLRYHYDALVVVARFQVNTCSVHYVCGGE